MRPKGQFRHRLDQLDPMVQRGPMGPRDRPDPLAPMVQRVLPRLTRLTHRLVPRGLSVRVRRSGPRHLDRPLLDRSKARSWGTSEGSSERERSCCTGLRQSQRHLVNQGKRNVKRDVLYTRSAVDNDG
jgi:hypothetical protein